MISGGLGSERLNDPVLICGILALAFTGVDTLSLRYNIMKSVGNGLRLARRDWALAPSSRCSGGTCVNVLRFCYGG